MMIHLVMGPPCSGKSTFVKQNAPFGVPRFDFDLLSSTVAGGDVAHDPPQGVVDAVLAMRHGMIGWVLDDETTIDDIWIINARPPENLINRLAAAGADLRILDPGKDVCLERAKADNRPQHTIDRIEAWYASPPKIPDNDDEKDKKGGDPPVIKNLDVRIKSADADADDGAGVEPGTIEAYASVFDNVDSYGDVVRRGAFAETLAEWDKSGNKIPLLYGHDFGDPFSNIGVVTSAVEDAHGLKIVARLDLENQKAAQVHKLMKEKRLTQMSFAFRVLDGGEIEVDGKYAYEIKRVQLYEVSVVPIGANEATEILTVKAPGGSPPDKSVDTASAEKSKSIARARSARAFLMLLERTK